MGKEKASETFEEQIQCGIDGCYNIVELEFKETQEQGTVPICKDCIIKKLKEEVKKLSEDVIVLTKLYRKTECELDKANGELEELKQEIKGLREGEEVIKKTHYNFLYSCSNCGRASRIYIQKGKKVSEIKCPKCGC